jgi:hypothetical protein
MQNGKDYHDHLQYQASIGLWEHLLQKWYLEQRQSSQEGAD